MANLSLFSMSLLVVSSLFQINEANAHNRNGLSFKLIYHDTLEFLSYQSNLTVQEKSERLINSSRARFQFLEHLASNYSSESPNQFLRPPLYNQFGQSLFLIQVGIGTFSARPTHKTYNLELDTGSGIIWTQCEGCNPCFNQRDPPYPRSQSRTYRALPCNQCPQGTTCQQDHCRVDRSYADGTRVQGIAARETFMFGSNINGTFVSMQNLMFTCVLRTHNFPFGTSRNNTVSGIFGMSRERSSFVSQIGTQIGGRFSYCLQPLDYPSQRPPMFLQFGDDIPRLHLHHRHHTPLLNGPYPHYYLSLRAISVGPDMLNINPDVFQLKPDGSGGCLIDSGAGASRLANVAYVEFERVLRQKIEAENPGIMMTSRKPQLCYKQRQPRARTIFPRVTFHFANDADFVVEPEAYMLGFSHPNPQVYCLLMQPSDRFTFTVLGASQQVNHRIIYDTVNSQLHFAPENCVSAN